MYALTQISITNHTLDPQAVRSLTSVLVDDDRPPTLRADVAAVLALRSESASVPTEAASALLSALDDQKVRLRAETLVGGFGSLP